MRFDGILKSWNEERGFGFIAPLQGGDDIFVHVKALPARSARPPALNQALSFELEHDPRGRKRARNVQWARVAQPARRRDRASASSSHASSPAQWGTASLFAIPAFAVLYGVIAFVWRVPALVALFYLLASLLCFVAYALDKSAARQQRWRISENKLLLLGLAGGWPGAIVAQQLLRHKSSKTRFRSAFWGTVVLNVAGFVVWFSPLRGMVPLS
jgi:uncharacterized membrane protein YsdA (DUF1294 family)/cold shock CspA family protein